MSDIRIGQGYDVHAFNKGDYIMLGGVKIPNDQAIDAHSDGDVAIHALCDAIFGALCEGDIGTHFPPSDDKWKNAPSEIFLNFAREKLIEHAYSICNLDITIIAETPKIGPFRDEITSKLSHILNIEKNQVSIKATTHEKLGSLGRKEGIAALAIVLITKENR